MSSLRHKAEGRMLTWICPRGVAPKRMPKAELAPKKAPAFSETRSDSPRPESRPVFPIQHTQPAGVLKRASFIHTDSNQRTKLLSVCVCEIGSACAGEKKRPVPGIAN